MKPITSRVVPLMLLTQAFTLIISTKGGETIEIPTDDIVKMEFEPTNTPDPEPEQLRKPTVTATLTESTVKIDWTAVEHATGYRYTIDQGAAQTTQTRTLTIPAETGTHTISVVALGDNDLYLDSEPGIAYYTYSPDITYTPGETGTVFAYGTNMQTGWYDVDKIYSEAANIWPGATDANMCWACSTAGCLQWWLDEYEKEFGQKPALRYDIPETSDYYSTPMMDIMVSTFPDEAYDAYKAYQWFFIPIARPENYTNNGNPTFLADSPYKYGGFLQRDQAFVEAYSKKYTAWELFPLTDPADKIEQTFSPLVLKLLSEGAVEITVNKGNHSIILWGADYVVKADGKPKVTRVYLCENGSPSNRINGIEISNVNYVTGDVKLDGNWNNLTSMTVLRSPRVVKIP